MPLIGNKITEAEVRRWLIAEGYGAKTAVFDEVELHAIKRPGWVQVYRYGLTALTPDERKVPLFGAVRDDGRAGATYRVTEDEQERDRWLEEWSEGLIRDRRHGGERPPAPLVWLLIAVVAALVTTAALL